MMKFTAPLLVLLCCAGAQAQIGQATISGSVVDTSDAAIVGAEVTARHVATNQTFESVSTQTGAYTFPKLPIGAYEISATAPGFKRAVRTGINLQVDDNQVVTFRMELGVVSESVEVSAAAALVNTSDATVGKVIESERITSLPINGRSVLSLVLLTPNVQGHTVNQSGFGDRGDAVSNFSVNGGPSMANNIILDGTSNTSLRYGSANVSPAVDAVEEFKVQSGVVSAEYGFTAGGVVNLITKSGGNAFHGTLYEFIRNKTLTARNAFATDVAPLVYNQYGGSLGGPIRRNKTFFFANYEEWRLAQGYTAIATVPTAAERTGDFSQLRDANGTAIPIYNPNTSRLNPAGAGYINDPYIGNIIPPSQLDAVSLNILKFYPLPNTTPTNRFTNANNFQINQSGLSTARQETFKVDHRLTAGNNLSVRYVLWDPKSDNATNSIFADLVARKRDDDYLTRNANITDTQVLSPSLINETRLGFSQLHFSCIGGSAGQGWPQKLGMPASVPSSVMPKVSIQAYPSFPANMSTFICLLSAYTPQVNDTLTWVHGRQTIKIGADLRRNRFNRSSNNNAAGTYNFTSTVTGNLAKPAGTGSGLASFMTGAVATATAITDAGVTFQNYTQSYFIQDDLKLTRRLTFNLGLRYDYQQPMRESHNRISNFNPYVTNPQNKVLGALQFAGIDYGNSIVNPNYHDFAPRAGFSFDVFGNGKASVRGGYGLYYPSTFSLLYFADGSAGFSNITTTYQGVGGTTQLAAFQLRNGLPSQPLQPLGAAIGPSAFEGQAVTYIPSEGQTPYSQQWTLLLQYQLHGGFLVEAGYSGNKGTSLVTVPYNLNQLDPKYYSLGSALLNQVPNPYAGRVSGAFSTPTVTLQQSLLPYPYYGAINVTSPRQGSSIYHSWLVNVEKRMSHGFVMLASYTFGKLIDENTVGINSGQANSDQLAAGAGYRLGPYNRRLDRSLDPVDAASRVVFSSVYELPVGAGKLWNPPNAVVRAAASGWQLNGLMVLQDGLPIVVRGANNFLADRPNSTGKSAKLSNPTQSQWFDTTQFVNPPNWTLGNVGGVLPDVRNPGLFNINLSVIKNTKIRENWNLQFRAEAFNLLNKVNLLGPNATFVPGANGLNSSATFGTINSARDPRNMQLALKLLF